MTTESNAVAPKTRPGADPARHGRKCCICSHPDRADIEEDFLHWVSLERIAHDYHLYDRRAIYRHAHATGLSARRSRKVRFVLETFLERAEKVAASAYPNVTARNVIDAGILYAQTNDQGELVLSPKTITVVRICQEPPSPNSQHSQDRTYASPTPRQADSQCQTKSPVSL